MNRKFFVFNKQSKATDTHESRGYYLRPGIPITPESELKRTKKSSVSVKKTLWRFHVPLTLGDAVAFHSS